MQSPRGRSQTLTSQLETNLVDAVQKMEAMGLGPTMQQFRIIVKDYILLNNISCRFKDGMPGPDWVIIQPKPLLRVWCIHIFV